MVLEVSQTPYSATYGQMRSSEIEIGPILTSELLGVVLQGGRVDSTEW